jgi:PAS domain S-box-containing protein
MQKSETEQTTADISLLYELALSCGKSLSIYENCEQFLQRLMSKKNFHYCAAWIRDSYQHADFSNDASLVYSYPDRYSLKKTLESDSRLFQHGDENGKNIYTVEEEYISSLLDDSVTKNGSVIIYRLMDFGVLILASDQTLPSLEAEVNQLQTVLLKFAVSLHCCLSHQHLLTEVEERKKAIDMLSENENKLKQVQNFASMGVWEYSISDNKLRWSEECRPLFGLKDDQLPESFEAFLEYVYPDDLQYVIEINSPITELKQGVPLSYEHRIVKKTGEVRWVREEADLILNENGEAVKLLGMVIDITEQKQAEEIITKANTELEKMIQERTREILDTNIALSDEVNERRLVEKAIRELLQSEKMIAEISSLFVLSAPEDLNQCIDKALQATGQLYGVDRSYIFLFSADGAYMDNTNEWCAPGIEPEIKNLQQLDVELFSWWIKNLINKKTINIPIVDKMPQEAAMEKETLKAQGIQSVLVAPLVAQEKLLGYMGFDSVVDQKRWSDEQISILKVVADIISSNIIRMRYEQTLAEEKELLSVTLRSIAEGLIVIGTDQQITILNERAEKLTGWSSQDAAGRLLSEVITIIDTETNEFAIDPLQAIIAGSWINNRHGRLAMVNREGKIMNITALVADIKDSKGRLRGSVLAFQDITDKLKAEAQAALSEKLKSIGQLAAGIAHEINTPMQYIGDNTVFVKDSFEVASDFIERLRAYFNNLDRSCADHKMRELADLYDELNIEYRLVEGPLAIAQTLEGVERVSRLVRAMKGFARSGAAGKKSADLNAAIGDTLTVSRNAWKYNAEIILELDENLPPVTCEIDAINQVLLNLVINAAQSIETAVDQKYYKQGSIHIATRVEDAFAVIEIRDDGIGIAQADQDRIFDPFFTTKEVGKGTGQGLMIAHDVIVDKHGGSIEFSSETGKGATFWIKLPLPD